MAHPFNREFQFVAELVTCKSELQALDARALPALFTRPFDHSVASTVDTVFATAQNGFAPDCRNMVRTPVLALLEQAVALLKRVDWADAAARMRAQPALRTPGIMHEPIFLSGLDRAPQRTRSCCCWAGVLLLLVYSLLMHELLAVPCTLEEYLAAGHTVMADVWQPLCSAVHALLHDLQPGFSSYANGVNMVSDTVQVRAQDACAGDPAAHAPAMLSLPVACPVNAMYWHADLLGDEQHHAGAGGHGFGGRVLPRLCSGAGQNQAANAARAACKWLTSQSEC